MTIRCGLCQKEVKDWKKHSMSKEHLKNLFDEKEIGKALENHCKAMSKTTRGK